MAFQYGAFPISTPFLPYEPKELSLALGAYGCLVRESRGKVPPVEMLHLMSIFYVCTHFPLFFKLKKYTKIRRFAQLFFEDKQWESFPCILMYLKIFTICTRQRAKSKRNYICDCNHSLKLYECFSFNLCEPLRVAQNYKLFARLLIDYSLLDNYRDNMI
jgi:hypothetical protein